MFWESNVREKTRKERGGEWFERVCARGDPQSGRGDVFFGVGFIAVLSSRGLISALLSHSQVFSVIPRRSQSIAHLPVIPCRLVVPWSRGLVVS